MSAVEWWWLGIAIFGAVTVVVAVLLGAIIAAARRVDYHAAGIWTVGREIAGNTVAIWMMERTNQHLDKIEGRLRKLEDDLDSLDQKLGRSLQGGGG